jgi:hypothetical protein
MYKKKQDRKVFQSVVESLIRILHYRPMSCDREFSSLQGKVSVTLQPSSAVFFLCKREKIPFAKESRSHDMGHCPISLCLVCMNALARSAITVL